MERTHGSGVDVCLPAAAFLLLAVTVLLTYAGDALEAFRGSSLAYVGWTMLAVSGVAGVVVCSRSGHGAVVAVRNVAFLCGVVLIGFAVGLALYADSMFTWWPPA